MKRIVKLTENDLTRIVRRVIKEQEMDGEENNEGVLEITEKIILLDGASEETVSKVLSNLTGSERFIAILRSEYADFSGIDLCSFSELNIVNLKGTENNFEEQDYDCSSTGLGSNDMYDFMDRQMQESKRRFKKR
jgi:hypothetical protein